MALVLWLFLGWSAFYKHVATKISLSPSIIGQDSTVSTAFSWSTDPLLSNFSNKQMTSSVCYFPSILVPPFKTLSNSEPSVSSYASQGLSPTTCLTICGMLTFYSYFYSSSGSALTSWLLSEVEVTIDCGSSTILLAASRDLKMLALAA